MENHLRKSHTAALEAALIILLGAVVFLPNLGQEISLKKDEAKHAEIARNMLWTGQYAVPYTCGRPYIDKPPLYAWAVAAIFRLTDRIDFYAPRLVSALSAILASLAIFILGMRWVSARAGLLAAIMWVTCWMTIEWGRFSRMDMMMAALILCGVLLADLAATAQGRKRTWLWLLSCVTVGASALTKNLLVLFFFAPAVAAIWRARHGRWLMPAGLAAAGLAVSVLPYVAWAAAAEVARPGHLAAMWNYQTGEGIVEHAGGVVVYLVDFPAQMLPWVVFVGGAAYWSYRRLRRQGFDTAAIPAFASAMCLALLLAMPSKRPHYALPMLPFWFLWLGGFLDRGLQSRIRETEGEASDRDIITWWAFELPLGGALIGLFAFLAWGFEYWISHAYEYKAAGAAIAAVTGAIVAEGILLAFRHRHAYAVAALCVALLVLSAAGCPVFLPGLNEPAPEYAAAEDIAAMIPRDAPAADYDARNPLVSLKLNRSVTFVDDLERLKQFMEEPGRRYVLVRPKHARDVTALTERPVRVLATYTLRELSCAVLEVDSPATPSGAAVTPAENDLFHSAPKR